MTKKGKPSSLRIRPGTRKDVPTILRMIRGLAEYEKRSHQVSATPARLREHGFGASRYFRTLLCFRGRQAIGFALYFFTYSTFLAKPTLYLEDIFVLPEDRGAGAGNAMLAELARIAVQRGCGRMEWSVLHWNAPAIRFYKHLGAKPKTEWITQCLKGEPLHRLARRSKSV